MGFIEKWFPGLESKVPEQQEAPFSKKKLQELLGLWTNATETGDTISQSFSQVEYKNRVDELLSKIIEHITNLPPEDVENAYKEAGLNPDQVLLLKGDIFQHQNPEKNLYKKA